MKWRQANRYVAAALILATLGLFANLQAPGVGQAARPAEAALPTEVSAAGVNAFASGAADNLDFAFYEDFLRTRNGAGAGADQDKTGQWSVGTPTRASDFDRAPGFRQPTNVNAFGTTGDPSDRGVFAPLSGPQSSTGSPVTDWMLNMPGSGAPGIVVTGFTPGAQPPPPPITEVPVPPAALLFITALSGFSFARRKRTG
jgi:hypothetical protein